MQAQTEGDDEEQQLPDWTKIPGPIDDGATLHLVGVPLAPVALRSTDGTDVDLSTLSGRLVSYAYPRTGTPGIDNPPGWDLIPGARGCTPQACSFRDHFAELRELGVDHVFGLSTQDPVYQREVSIRLQLPFAILSDDQLRLTRAMNLPLIETEGMTLLKRFTLLIRDGTVEHVFYPVFPADRSAADVADTLLRTGSSLP